jgi:competence protein ComEA
MRRTFKFYHPETALHRCMRAVRRAGLAIGLSMSILAVSPAHAEVNVNSADEAGLATIKGIGPATARRIAEERGKNGAFKDGNDLADRVPGIGPKSVANLEAAGLTFGKAADAPRKDARPAPKAAVR